MTTTRCGCAPTLTRPRAGRVDDLRGHRGDATQRPHEPDPPTDAPRPSATAPHVARAAPLCQPSCRTAPGQHAAPELPRDRPVAPTPEMILRLAEHLDVPLRRRDDLLLAAGYAPRSRAAPSTTRRWPGCSPVCGDCSTPICPTRRCCSTGTGTSSTPTLRSPLLLDGVALELREPPMNASAPEPAPARARAADTQPGRVGGHLHQQVVHRAERTFDPRLVDLADELAGCCRRDRPGRRDRVRCCSLDLDAADRCASSASRRVSRPRPTPRSTSCTSRRSCRPTTPTRDAIAAQR